MDSEAKILVTVYKKGFSNPNKLAENNVFEKELVVGEKSIIGVNGNLVKNKEEAEMGMYVVIDEINQDEIKITAFGFSDQSNKDQIDLGENVKEQHYTIKKFQQLTLNVPLLGGGNSLCIMFLELRNN